MAEQQGKQGLQGEQGKQGEPGPTTVLISKRSVLVLQGIGIYIAVALTALVIAVASGLGENDSQNKEIKTLANQNRVALCGLRGDLENRVAGSKEFLKTHPNGLPKLGVTPADIEHEIDNQERTIGTLEVLSCVGVFVPKETDRR